METLNAIKNRRAVKQFDPDHVMSDQEKKELLEAARLSPTAFNIQHWRFVCIEDSQLRQKIRDVAWNQSQVTDSSLLIILCADLKAWEKNPARYWQSAPKEVQDFMVPAIDDYYRGKLQVERDEVMRSNGIAGQTIMLAAKALGYDTCPMDGFDFDAVGKLINLPDDHVISYMIAVGKKAADPKPRPDLLPYNEVVLTDSF